MNPNEFHKGPPPHRGWWPTKIGGGVLHHWRWWNGEDWSRRYTHDEMPPVNKLGKSAEPSTAIFWSHFWPENARVPRLDPTDGEWTFWHGGKCPVERLTVVEVAYRQGVITHGLACLTDWDHRDIVAYRISLVTFPKGLRP